MQLRITWINKHVWIKCLLLFNQSLEHVWTAPQLGDVTFLVYLVIKLSFLTRTCPFVWPSHWYLRDLIIFISEQYVRYVPEYDSIQYSLTWYDTVSLQVKMQVDFITISAKKPGSVCWLYLSLSVSWFSSLAKKLAQTFAFRDDDASAILEIFSHEFVHFFLLRVVAHDVTAETLI